MEGAQGVLMSIAGGSDLGLSKSTRPPRWCRKLHPEANIIFGTVIDDSLGDEVRVTVIAAGFDPSSINRNVITAAPGTAPAAKATGQVPTTPAAGGQTIALGGRPPELQDLRTAGAGRRSSAHQRVVAFR